MLLNITSHLPQREGSNPPLRGYAIELNIRFGNIFLVLSEHYRSERLFYKVVNKQNCQ